MATIKGTSGNDQRGGGAAADSIFGLAGDDTLFGDSGNDVITGGDDNDRLFGNYGNDRLEGGSGRDFMDGGLGDDVLAGGDNDDALLGNSGADAIDGRRGRDRLKGGHGNDSVEGGTGNDLAKGGTGNDDLQGQGGNDQLNGQAGDDRLSGGSGNDGLSGDLGNDALTGGAGNDRLLGELGDDMLSGGEGRDYLNGGAGNDDLEGGAGNDRLLAENGDDTLSGDEGDDVLLGQSGVDLLLGGAGNDVLDGGDGDDEVFGGVGADTIFGLHGDDTLSGEDGDDRILGGFGGDILVGGTGDDHLNGEAGNDVLDGGAGNDTLSDTLGKNSYDGGAGDDAITVVDLSFVSAAGGAGSDLLTFTGKDLQIDLSDLVGDSLSGIEAIDITGSGDNKLVLSKADVLALSDTGTLRIDGNAGDVVDLGIAFSETGTILSDGKTYTVYESGDAKVEVALDIEANSGIKLANLDGTNGFRIDGEAEGDRAGISVASVGDLNGDGFDDVVVSAFRADANGTNSGAAYVIFGSGKGFESTIDLSTLDGTTGFKLNGVVEYDQTGRSVSSAGDLNGDGFDDLIIGAPNSDVGGPNWGVSYVVFGSDSFASSIELSDLDGTNGFRLVGEGSPFAYGAGRSVSSAGDVNGDGIDDIIIGVPNAYTGGVFSGAAFVVFGSTEGFASSIDLKTVDGTWGFRLEDSDGGDGLGKAVASAGDVNGDGFDDLILGAPDANAPGFNSGAAYVVFGSASGVSAIDIGTLDGSNGFRVSGTSNLDYAGSSVASAGDINGDGFADVVIGSDADTAFVVFGAAGGFAPDIDVATLDGTTGLRIVGVGDHAGVSVSSAGDINGDGIGDLLIGDSGSFSNPGEVYVVYGDADGFASTIDLATIGGSTGFRIDAVTTRDGTGGSVSAAGDVNGDGFDDLIIGASYADVGGDASGAAYVIFGGDFRDEAAFVGTEIADTFTGTATAEIIFGAQGDDKLTGGDGEDLINGGSGNDQLIGGDGNDRLLGRSGADDVVGEIGDDVLDGGAGNDTVSGGAGNDSLFGGDGDDSLFDSAGNDSLDGGAGNDQLYGEVGDDVITGGLGNDTLSGGAGNDISVGGEGDDFLIDHSGSNFLDGGAGNDLLYSGGGDDVLIGGAGNDVLHIGNWGTGGNNSFDGGTGDDAITVADLDFISVAGGEGSDRLTFTGNNILIDLSAIDNSKLSGIDAIDLAGTGDNTIVLDAAEVVALSDSGTLRVDGDAGDIVDLSLTFSSAGTVDVNGETYNAYLSGSTFVLVDQALTVQFHV